MYFVTSKKWFVKKLLRYKKILIFVKVKWRNTFPS